MIATGCLLLLEQLTHDRGVNAATFSLLPSPRAPFVVDAEQRGIGYVGDGPVTATHLGGVTTEPRRREIRRGALVTTCRHVSPARFWFFQAKTAQPRRPTAGRKNTGLSHVLLVRSKYSTSERGAFYAPPRTAPIDRAGQTRCAQSLALRRSHVRLVAKIPAGVASGRCPRWCFCAKAHEETSILSSALHCATGDRAGDDARMMCAPMRTSEV